MHLEILSKEQHKLLPVLKLFSKKFGMVGGTAIALHIGHRRSIDFDLFSNNSKFRNSEIKNKVQSIAPITNIIIDQPGELTFLCDAVKMTFYEYPFVLRYDCDFDKFINIPDLLTLAAMKAHAISQRNKWKDYVDLYFIIRDHYSVDEIIKKGKELFEGHFNGKLFRVQLAYFKDINYEEKVEFMPGFAVPEKKIKKALVEFSLD